MRDAFDESDLLRLLEGDCSPDEAARLQVWVAADEGRARLLTELRAVWRVTGGTTRAWSLVGARKRLEHTRFPLHSRITELLPRAWGQSRAWRLRIAAAIALVLVGAAAWLSYPSAPRFQEHATLPGQRSQVTLPDGTQVLLGVHTRLRVSRDYSTARRAVELEGEAYFIVRHDAARPFVVRTTYGAIEVLGTEFDIRAYRGEPLQVVVAAGAVALRAGVDSAVLTLGPRDLGVVDALGFAAMTPDVLVKDYVAWTGGLLIFHNEALGSAIPQLARWYDLRIALSDPSLAERRLTLTLGPEPSDEAIAALGRALNLDVARAGKSVCLSSPPEATTPVNEAFDPATVTAGTLGEELVRRPVLSRDIDQPNWRCGNLRKPGRRR